MIKMLQQVKGASPAKLKPIFLHYPTVGLLVAEMQTQGNSAFLEDIGVPAALARRLYQHFTSPALGRVWES